uniref:hypothetical protein n=1 Tax=Nitrosopumilus sp. TaxID=2024843 RepID=UPI002632F158
DLTETLEFVDDIDRTISVDLTETIEFVDNVERTLTVDLTETLEFVDDINRNIPVTLTETLEFVDDIDRTFTVDLTETLEFVDDIDRTFTVNLTETIEFVDNVERTLIASISLVETLSLIDNVDTEHDATTTLIETLTFTASATGLANLGIDQILIEDDQPAVAITDDNKELVITSTDIALETIELVNADDVVMNYTLVQTGNTVTIDNGWTASSDLDASVTSFDVEVTVADSTVVTGPTGWNGLLNLPTLTSVAPADTSDVTYDDVTSIEIGLSADELTFDEPIRIEFKGDGGDKGFVAFFKRAGDSTVTFIDKTCDADNLATVDAQLGTSDQCKIDDGTDLIVWTTHFTSFGDARSSRSSSSGDSGSSSSGGSGGGSGGGGGGGASSGFAGILETPLSINEVSYDKCDENMVRILVSSDAELPPTVTLYTAKLGTVQATLAESQPFAESNQITNIDKYVYEAPLAEDELFFTVRVTEIGTDGQQNTVQTIIHADECSESITVVDAPTDEQEITIDRPRIFDTKFQIGSGEKQKSSIESVLYLDKQDLTVSAIVDSKSLLKRVELRTVPLGELDQNYIAMRMNVTAIDVSNTSYIVTATLPSYFMVEPGLKYWIHVLDDEGYTVDSRPYEIGVKPTKLSNVSVEMDVPTVKAAGSSITSEVYVFTNNAPAYGKVSLIADGKVVSERAQFFDLGQTKVTFDWNVPESDSYSRNELQGKVELYDSSISTSSAVIHSHPKTLSMPASELASLGLIEIDGQLIAEPALLYSSNSDDNMQFRITDPQGQCVIGGTDDCTINESTKDNRGGLTSIMYGDQVLRVRYSGAENALERFSITSIDPITQPWTVTLETTDESMLQEAHATSEPIVKVKYRYHSETITVFSN